MPEEKILKEATVVFLRQKDKVLLARKTRAIGQGRWNGYGGGLEPGESPEKCAIRELLSESGLAASPADLRKIAVIYAHNVTSAGVPFICKVHIYELWSWSGKVQATEEMAEPSWFELAALPLDEMMPADKDWVPLALAGRKVSVHMYYTPFQQGLTREVEIEKVSQL